MHDIRFEDLVRQTLRDDAARLPFTITAETLERRLADRRSRDRSRSIRWLLVAAAVAALVGGAAIVGSQLIREQDPPPNPIGHAADLSRHARRLCRRDDDPPAQRRAGRCPGRPAVVRGARCVAGARRDRPDHADRAVRDQRRRAWAAARSASRSRLPRTVTRSPIRRRSPRATARPPCPSTWLRPSTPRRTATS